MDKQMSQPYLDFEKKVHRFLGKITNHWKGKFIEVTNKILIRRCKHMLREDRKCLYDKMLMDVKETLVYIRERFHCEDYPQDYKKLLKPLFIERADGKTVCAISYEMTEIDDCFKRVDDIIPEIIMREINKQKKNVKATRLRSYNTLDCQP